MAHDAVAGLPPDVRMTGDPRIRHAAASQQLLRLISPYVRDVWEDVFPELLRPAPADTTAA
ncbi:hypothetical protein [Streptomyces tirandamycinicus]|uniref:hypothetical protein n=1 Tax=Streptomyces tirandamycinicus TaxID=2174846 RepID=UPI0011B25743|nr:hypothetical protein [Streptomyces tirandamycinicus]